VIEMNIFLNLEMFCLYIFILKSNGPKC